MSYWQSLKCFLGFHDVEAWPDKVMRKIGYLDAHWCRCRRCKREWSDYGEPKP